MKFSRTTTGFFKKARIFDGLDFVGLFGGSWSLEGDFLNGLYGDMDFSMDCK